MCSLNIVDAGNMGRLTSLLRTRLAGEHFVGQVVQIPHLGIGIAQHREVSRDDVMGSVHGYDHATDTYTIAMDSGIMVRDIRHEQIRLKREKNRRRNV